MDLRQAIRAAGREGGVNAECGEKGGRVLEHGFGGFSFIHGDEECGKACRDEGVSGGREEEPPLFVSRSEVETALASWNKKGLDLELFGEGRKMFAQGQNLSIAGLCREGGKSLLQAVYFVGPGEMRGD
jgi:hypothetical protein